MRLNIAAVIDLLSPAGYDVIRKIARARTVLAFEFDGTLAPIVDRPADAQVGAHTRALLRAVAQLYPCAVVSGRARADLATRLASIPLAMLIGNHGAETSSEPPPPRVRTHVRAWVAALGEALRQDGIDIEDKGFTVSVHYRRAPDPVGARRRVLSLASALPRARVFGGHAAVNLAPVGVATRADGIAAFAARFPAAPLAFTGDDAGGEDAFRCPAVTYGICVGRPRVGAARYHLAAQRDVGPFLSALAAERSKVAGLRDGWRSRAPKRDAPD